MAKKITLKHALPCGEIATRTTAREYSHVVILRDDLVAVRASRDVISKVDLDNFRFYSSLVAAGAGNHYRHNSGSLSAYPVTRRTSTRPRPRSVATPTPRPTPMPAAWPAWPSMTSCGATPPGALGGSSAGAAAWTWPPSWQPSSKATPAAPTSWLKPSTTGSVEGFALSLFR